MYICICKNKLKFIKGKERIQYNWKIRRCKTPIQYVPHVYSCPDNIIINKYFSCLFPFSFPNATTSSIPFYLVQVRMTLSPILHSDHSFVLYYVIYAYGLIIIG
jgi:hypothetical protein